MIQNEYEQYRRDDDVPKQYEEGFGWKAVIGGLFVGFLLVPGGMFLNLMVGTGGYGDAVNWVTIILFTEIAKRCRTSLTKQETYILFSVSGGVLGMAVGSYVFSSFIWNQYLVQSPFAAKFDIAQRIPIWVAPPPGSEAYAARSLLHSDWWPGLLMMAIYIVWGQLNMYSLGYALFRLTSDVERLPFPMAPIAAQGVTALAESDKETWRWRVFTIASTIGIAFGTIYVAVPTITGVVFNSPISLIPIPFIDLTTNFQDILPAVPLALATDLSIIFVGFVLPFWAIVGGAIGGTLGQLVINPVLHHYGVLKTWTRGSTVIETGIANGTDFWLSWGIGTGVGVALIGFYTAIRGVLKSGSGPGKALKTPAGRGDIPILMSILFYVVSTFGTIMLCHVLVPKFPIWILVFFGFVYTPLMSYVSARMVGLTGSGVGFPYVKEASFVLSGYKGVDIWWAPIPLGDFGPGTQGWRQMELTGTKFTSIIKAQLFIIPVAIISSLFFWSFIWKMSEIPSASYPYAMRFWPQDAFWQCFWRTATTTGNEYFLSTIKPWFVVFGGIFAIGTFGLLSVFGLPTLLLYGVIMGLQQSPMNAVPMLAAALIGRYYFAKRFGVDNWYKYTPILMAGYACGYGLIGMVSIAVSLISKAVSQMPF